MQPAERMPHAAQHQDRPAPHDTAPPRGAPQRDAAPQERGRGKGHDGRDKHEEGEQGRGKQ